MEIMIYNIDFDLCAVVISVISLFFILLKKGLQRESNRLPLLYHPRLTGLRRL